MSHTPSSTTPDPRGDRHALLDRDHVALVCLRRARDALRALPEDLHDLEARRDLAGRDRTEKF